MAPVVVSSQKRQKIKFWSTLRASRAAVTKFSGLKTICLVKFHYKTISKISFKKNKFRGLGTKTFLALKSEN